jgi:hypothetical protein
MGNSSISGRIVLPVAATAGPTHSAAKVSHSCLARAYPSICINFLELRIPCASAIAGPKADYAPRAQPS